MSILFFWREHFTTNEPFNGSRISLRHHDHVRVLHQHLSQIFCNRCFQPAGSTIPRLRLDLLCETIIVHIHISRSGPCLLDSVARPRLLAFYLCFDPFLGKFSYSLVQHILLHTEAQFYGIRLLFRILVRLECIGSLRESNPSEIWSESQYSSDIVDTTHTAEQSAILPKLLHSP